MNITKIKLSSHLFLVERGRWGVNRIERNQRLCTLCGCLEDEFHCILECPRSNNERLGLVPDYIIKSKNMRNFVYFLSTTDLKEQRKLGLLCLKIQKEYREIVLNT